MDTDKPRPRPWAVRVTLRPGDKLANSASALGGRPSTYATQDEAALAALAALDEALAPAKFAYLRTVVRLYDAATGRFRPTVHTFATFTELALALRPAIYKPLMARAVAAAATIKRPRPAAQGSITSFFTPATPPPRLKKRRKKKTTTVEEEEEEEYV